MPENHIRLIRRSDPLLHAPGEVPEGPRFGWRTSASLSVDAFAAIGRDRSAAHAAVRQLVDAGVPVPPSTSKRNRLPEASGLTDLVEGLHAGRPS